MTRAPEVFCWIVDHLDPVWSQDGARLYEGMESQSAFSLPLIHVPFDPDALAHWKDRGRILDFRAVVGGGRILDLGSGDGWPCLPLAAMVEEVVAVDASANLLAVAKANAQRLGIRNVSFVGIRSATALPFADASFDGVTASSSLEQTEDPAAALAEVRRVLRPGGRLRMYYEPPSRYRPGEHGLWLMGRSDGTSLLFVSAYDPDAERAQHIRVHVDLSASEMRRRMTGGEGPVAIEQLSLPLLESLVPHVRDACGARLRLPRGTTWLRLLEEAGFAETEATRSGKEAAADLYARVGAGKRPRTLAALDDLLRPHVDEAVRTPCDVALDPMITARLS